MNVKHLHYLRLVIEQRSFAAAARAAEVSQPAITQAMHALEQELGIALFEKSGRQKLPTRAAREIAYGAAHFEGVLAGVQSRRLHGARPVAVPASANIFRVGMAPAAALLYAPAVESAWRALAPDGLLRISGASAPDMLDALVAGELDLVIAPRPRGYQAAGVRRHALHTSMPTVFARRGHPLLEARTLNDLADAGWAVTGEARTAGNMIEEAHRVRDLPAPRVRVQCPDYRALMTLVADGDLLCIVPHLMLVPGALQEAVRPLQLLESLPRYEVCMFWSGARPDPAVDAVVAAVKRVKPAA